MDIAARFILGGTVVLVASEHLAYWGSGPAQTFFLSPAWLVLRYALFATAFVMCLVVVASGS